MLYIFNTTICPTPGLTYHTRTITAVEARRLLEAAYEQTLREGSCFGHYMSAIGHETTAQVATALLGCPVGVNRIAATMTDGDSAICVKLRGRAPEGVILTTEQMEEIGYDLVLMDAVDQSKVAQECYLRIDPNAPWEERCPPLEEGAAALVKSFDSWVKSQRKAERESGASYSPDTPFDDLRAGMVRLCREVIESHITSARESCGDVGCSAEDARRVREGLVSRLVDVLQETVQVMSVRPREDSPFETTIHVA